MAHTQQPRASHGLNRRLRRLYWSALKRINPSKPIVVPFDHDLKIGVRPLDRLSKSVYLDGCSDEPLRQLLYAMVKPGMTVLDVGAHIGQFTLISARLVGPTGHVHAFEATKDMFTQLSANVAMNQIPWAKPVYAAVTEKPGMVTLNVCVPGKAEFNSISKPLRPDDQVVGVEKVQGIALDDYCAEQKITHVDFCKIDVNGPELPVLRGWKNLLAKPDAPALFLEFNDFTTAPLNYTTKEMRTQLEQWGYHIFLLDEANVRLVVEPPRERYDETVNIVAVKSMDSIPSSLLPKK